MASCLPAFPFFFVFLFQLIAGQFSTNYSLWNMCSPCYDDLGDNMQYQEVLADTELGENGVVQPKIIYYAHKSYPVKRILSTTRDVVYKYGVGHLFIVEIGSQQRKVFRSANTGRWLVEKQEPQHIPLAQGGRHCCADVLELFNNNK